MIESSAYPPQLCSTWLGTNLQEPLQFIHAKIQLVLLPNSPQSPEVLKLSKASPRCSWSCSSRSPPPHLSSWVNLKVLVTVAISRGRRRTVLKWVAWACLVLEDQNITAVMFGCSQILGTTSYVATCARALPLYTFSCRWEQFCLLCIEDNHRFLGTLPHQQKNFGSSAHLALLVVSHFSFTSSLG